MPNGFKFLLIDGQNLCFREFYAKKNLSCKGRSVDVIFGVFRSLVSYHKKWPDYFRIFAWDGGYQRRLIESEAGVAAGIVPESYKQARRDKAKAEPNPDIESLFEQIDELKVSLDLTKTLQVRVDGFEADDVINTYSKMAVESGGSAVIVSSDQDFFQCLRPGVTVFDARAQETWTDERMRLEFGFSSELWVDKGAIEGEVGSSKDNIFGCEGWGPVTACKYIREFGDVDAILKALRGKQKLGKKEQKFIESEARLVLAKSLKRMDVIPNLPRPRITRPVTEDAVKAYFLEWGFASLLKDAWRFA